MEIKAAVISACDSRREVDFKSRPTIQALALRHAHCLPLLKMSSLQAPTLYLLGNISETVLLHNARACFITYYLVNTVLFVVMLTALCILEWNAKIVCVLRIRIRYNASVFWNYFHLKPLGILNYMCIVLLHVNIIFVLAHVCLLEYIKISLFITKRKWNSNTGSTYEEIAE